MNSNGTRESDGAVQEPASLDSGRLRAAFQRVQAAQIAIRPQGNGASARDPRAHSNRAAFLALDDERGAIGARLQHADRHRGERYRDLVLITKLSRLEHEHLVGRIDGGAAASLPAEEPPALGRDAPAGWGHPWALGPLVELRASYAENRRQRDRVARQLLPGTRASIADEAQRSFERIVDRFEALRRESRFVPRAEGEPAADSRRNRIRFPRVAVAAALGVAALAVAVEAKLDTGTSQDQTSIPTAVAGDLGRSLPALSYRQPAGQRKNDERRKPETQEPQVQPVAMVSPRPTRAQRTVSQVPAAPVPAAPAAPAPAPQPSSEPPAPNPQPSPSSGGGGGGGGGPVSSLPPPVSNLPPPGSGGGG